MIATLQRQLCRAGSRDAASMKLMETPALLDAYLRKAFSAVTRMLATRSIRCAIGRAHGVHVANIGMMFQFLKDHRKLFM